MVFRIGYFGDKEWNGEVINEPCHAGSVLIYKVRPQKKGVNGGPCTTFLYSSISNLDK